MEKKTTAPRSLVAMSEGTSVPGTFTTFTIPKIDNNQHAFTIPQKIDNKQHRQFYQKTHQSTKSRNGNQVVFPISGAVNLFNKL